MQPVLRIPLWDSVAWTTVAVVVFWSAGASSMHCGWMFVRYGGGTPLPLDQTTRFTVLGLYRHVRNPMAVLGILQGVMVGLYLGSWLVMVYSLLGVVAWEIFVRPYEEEDLLRRFGEEYATYRSAVPRWLPGWKPYPKVLTDAGTSVTDGPPYGGLG
ncbi:MAG: isoprenylcysteine carboxylmethyltransferase family protein [Armatimonadetes bacterium]|nr:isoprenylcysteine carboxylmethyltransferase family protein [Armatimonadota bacterium]